jgi:molybdopterin molybdotransferase
MPANLEFLQLIPPDQARQILLGAVKLQPTSEWVPLAECLGRVTVSPVAAPHPLPEFPRSTVDGYAVHAADTYGASDALPAYLTLCGEVPMGAAPLFTLLPTQCALIHTGGMVPEGADAVVMVEYTQLSRPGEIEIQRAVAVGENVIRAGEDVAAGDVVIPAGVRLRPAEIGGLAALGILDVNVACRPRVALLSSGDEVIPVAENPAPGQVRDVNTHTLAALVTQVGGAPVTYGILPDRLDALQAVAARALAECDVVVITAGSSASVRDLTAEAINALGAPGVLAHGVNVRPGKPTILAVCQGKAVIGLPGNPVSALVIADLFVRPVIEALQGLTPRPVATIAATLTLNLPSQAGREDWVPVRLQPTANGYAAEPIFGKSNLIFTLVRADGLICIPPNATGLQAGESVQVWRL